MFIEKDIFSLEEHSELLATLKALARHLVMGVLIWRGTYFLLTKRFKFGYVIELSVGLSFGLTLIVLAPFTVNEINKTIEKTQRGIDFPIEEFIKLDRPAKEKTDISHRAAQHEYVNRGVILDFINTDNKLEKFKPSIEDIEKWQAKERKLIEISENISDN